MSALYEVVGTKTAEALLTSPEGAQKIAVPMTPAKGTVARGAILVREAAGTWKAAAAADVDGTTMVAIANVEVNTSASTTAEDIDAFTAGRVARGKVSLTDTTTISAAVEVVLRIQGIILDPIA